MSLIDLWYDEHLERERADREFRDLLVRIATYLASGNRYANLSHKELDMIYDRWKAGTSVSYIAKAMGVTTYRARHFIRRGYWRSPDSVGATTTLDFSRGRKKRKDSSHVLR